MKNLVSVVLGKIWLVIASALAISGTIYAASRPAKEAKAPNKISYYADYVECNNIPVGINKLTQEQVAARHSHYRFTTKKNKVVSVSHCNSAGTPIAHENEWDQDRPVTMMFKYDGKGKAIKCTYVDEQGVTNMEWKLGPNYRECLAATGKKTDLFLDTCFQAEDIPDGLFSTGGRVARFNVERDAKGYVIRELYKNAQGAPFKDSAGVWGRAYERNDQGQVVRIQYLDEKGKPYCVEQSEIRPGVSSCSWERNAAGEIVKIVFTGKNGTSLPAIAKDQNYNWVTAEFTRDAATGNITEEAYYGADGQLRGRGTNAHEYAKAVMQYDTCGNRTEQDNYQKDGKAHSTWGCYAKKKVKFDDACRPVEEAYFDEAGKPTTLSNTDLCAVENCYEYAKKTMRYDANGKLVEEAFFGLDDKPCFADNMNHARTYAKKTMRYDTDRQSVETSYFDTEGAPWTNKMIGGAKIARQYDAFGRLTQEAYFDVDGKPCLNKQGFAKVTLQYDTRGNVTEQAFYDEAGEPCLSRSGVAKKTALYDSCGNKTEEQGFGIDGKPRELAKGFTAAKKTWKFDTKGNATEVAFFDVDGKPCRVKTTYKYDSEGNKVEEAYFGADGKPCWGEWGYAKEIMKYDAMANQTEIAFFGVDGKPCKDKNNGAAKMTCQYNERGYLTQQDLFGTDGKPCIGNLCWARKVLQYDKNGFVTEIAYFDENGKLGMKGKSTGWARQTVKYDEKYRVIEEAYYDADGKLCPGEWGWARRTVEYKALEKVVYYDKDGNVI